MEMFTVTSIQYLPSKGIVETLFSHSRVFFFFFFFLSFFLFFYKMKNYDIFRGSLFKFFIYIVTDTVGQVEVF